MKKIFLLCLTVLFCVQLNAQTNNNQLANFTIENKNVVWQNVYDTELNFIQLTEKIKESAILESIEITDDKITGKSKHIKLLNKEAGFTNMGTPWYVVGYYVQPTAIIEFKEGRYRVTLTNMSLYMNQTSPLGGIGEKDELETFALNGSKTKFTGQFTKTTSKIYNYTFLKEFDFNKSTAVDDKEW